MKKFLLGIILFSLILPGRTQFVSMPLNFPWDTTAYLTYWVSIVDQNTVWVGTAHLKNSGYIPYSEAIRTTDGGETWSFFHIPVPGSPWMQHLSAYDANTAYYLFTDGSAYGGSVYKTTDGGTSWILKTSGQFNGGWADVIHVFSQDTVVAIGDKNGGYLEVQFSSDGGDTWTRIPSSDIPAVLDNEYGTSGEYCAVGNSIWFPTNKGRIFHSSDKGLHWTVATVTDNFIRAAFTDEMNGIAVVPGMNSIYFTNDGGEHWVPSTASAEFLFGSLSRVPGIMGGIVATSSDTTLTSVYYSTTGFLSSTLIESGIHNASFIYFKAPDIGWLGGNFNPHNNIHKFVGTLTLVPGNVDTPRGLQITPNPAISNITIMTPGLTGPCDLSIINMNGVEVMKVVLEKSEENLDISSFIPGVYVVKVINGTSAHIGKFVKE